jgi:hypothetical protein
VVGKVSVRGDIQGGKKNLERGLETRQGTSIIEGDGQKVARQRKV